MAGQANDAFSVCDRPACISEIVIGCDLVALIIVIDTTRRRAMFDALRSRNCYTLNERFGMESLMMINKGSTRFAANSTEVTA